jgi:predicted Zn-dependent protease
MGTEKIRHKYALRVLMVVLLALSFSHAAYARFQAQPCNDAYTVQQEIDLGRKAAAQVYQQMPVLPDSDPMAQYIRSLGQKLQAVAPPTAGTNERWPFEFHVVNSEDINAFALPGGPMFVNLGAIQAADTEAQLAGVMAHEMSHVIQRHATCNATKEQKQGALFGILGAIAGAALGNYGQIAQAGVGAAAGLHFLTYSRVAEKQADLMGTDILYDAGYDPRGLPQFFEIITAKYGDGGAQFLSDHPNPGNRIEYVNAEIASLPPRRDLVKTTDNFRRIHERAMKMHAYTAAEIKAGGWKGSQPHAQSEPGDASVSGRSTLSQTCTARNDRKAFVHSLYTVNHPADWEIKGDTSSQVVTITPPGGMDQNGNIACGLLIGNQNAQSNAGSLADQMRALEQSIMQEDPNMRQVVPDDDVIVNKTNGRTAEFLTKSPLSSSSQTVQERDWIVALQRPDGGLTYIVFVAPDAQFETLRPVFENILRSFVVRR